MPRPRPDPALAWSGASDKRSYYRLFAAYVIALVATGVATVALALLAFDLAGEDSGAVLGTALSLKMIAYVAAAPVAAALTVRVARKPLLIGLDLIRAACLVLLPFVGAIWQIYALVFVFALASGAFTLVYLTVVPYLLGSPDDYAKSLARSRIAAEFDNSASPLIAAGLMVIFATAGVFAAATAAFLVSAALVAGADLPSTRTTLPDGLWRKVLHGPRLLLRTPALRGLVALDVAVAAASAMVLVNTVVIIQGEFDLARRSTAIAFAVFGLGSILGALAMPGILARTTERRVMLAGAVGLGLALLLGAAADTLYGLAAIWVALGLGVALALTPASYLIRRTARPDDLQSLFAAQFSISNACLALAYPIAGWLGAEAGIPAAFLALGACALAAALAAAWLWPASRPDGAVNGS